MIIDCHTHLFGTWMNLKGVAPQDFVARMDRLDIAKACVFTLKGFFDAQGCNDALAAQCRPYRGRLIPFCTVNPHHGQAALIELRRAVEKLGMKGLKLHPWLQAFPMNHEWFLRLVEETVRLDVPMLLHSASPPYCTPAQIANVARKYPRARFILGEAGAKDFWLEAAHCAAKYPNIHLCIGITPAEGLEFMAHRVPIAQLLFGSDLGFSTEADVRVQIDKVRRMDLSREDEERVFSGNILSLVDFK
ncbi:MAG: amidohydrolase family protein [Planctomycetota bacterium]